MYTAIKNYCDNDNTNGLFLLDMPTGYGKTYSVLKYIYEASMDEANSKKRFFFITTLKKNLPDEELRNWFAESDQLDKFNEKFLFIDANADCVIDCLTNEIINEIPIEIKKTDEYKSFVQDVKFLKEQENTNKVELRGFVGSIKDNLRSKSEPNFRRLLQTILAKEFSTVNERIYAIKTNKKWQWLGKLYPAVFKRISLFDWNALGLKEDIDFGVEVSDEQNTKYIFMTIHPDGTFNISEQTLNLFEVNRYNQCVEIFENAKINSEKIHGIIRDASGNINVIKDTGWFTIPEIHIIKAELSNGNTKLRGKEKRDELLSSCLEIKMFNDGNSEYYFVSTIGNGMRSLIHTAANIRMIEPFENSILMFEKLLPLMNVTFVHNKQLTIVPFPFKYLREYVNRLV